MHYLKYYLQVFHKVFGSTRTLEQVKYGELILKNHGSWMCHPHLVEPLFPSLVSHPFTQPSDSIPEFTAPWGCTSGALGTPWSLGSTLLLTGQPRTTLRGGMIWKIRTTQIRNKLYRDELYRTNRVWKKRDSS